MTGQDAGEGQRVEPRRDRYGRYLLPDPDTGTQRSWTRVTTLAKTISDTFALTAWSNRMVAAGMARRPDLVGLAASTPIDDKAALNRIAEQAKENAAASAGANSGTALHRATERADLGEAIELPPPWDADLAAYRDSLSGAGISIVPDLVERIVVLPELGVAGMVDRFLAMPGRDLWTGDLKTAKNIGYAWPEISIQLALYAHARYLWNPGTASYEILPEVDRRRGLVVHLPVGQARCDLYEIDLRAGWQAAQLCVEVRAWRARKDLAVPYRAEAADGLLERIAAAATEDELIDIWQHADARGRWNQQLTAAARRRKHQINAA